MKQRNKQTQALNSFIDILIAWIVTCFFLLVFSISTSPLTSGFWGSDSAFFQAAGKAMSQGKYMYKDIFDIKGPFLFFLQYLGYKTGFGRYAIFVMQCVFALVDVFFIRKIAAMTETKYPRLCFSSSMCAFLLIWSITIDCGNLVEEYSLPFLFGTAYLFFKFLRNKDIKHEGFWFGLATGIVILGRATNIFLIGVFVLVISVSLIWQKKIRQFITSVACFLAGLIIVPLGFYLYYWKIGVLEDMIFQSFIFPYQYAVESSLVESLLSIRWTIFIPFLLLSVYAFIITKSSFEKRMFLVVDTIGMLGLMCLGNAYIHYYQLLIPCLVVVVCFLDEKVDVKDLRIKRLVILFLAGSILLNGYNLARHCGRIFVATILNKEGSENSSLGKLAVRVENLDSYSKGTYGYKALLEINEVLEQIPKEDYDSILTYDVRTYFHLITNIEPLSRYWTTLDHFTMLSPDIENEILGLLKERKPQYIISGHDAIGNENIHKYVFENYQKIFENSNYTLYQLD